MFLETMAAHTPARGSGRHRRSAPRSRRRIIHRTTPAVILPLRLLLLLTVLVVLPCDHCFVVGEEASSTIAANDEKPATCRLYLAESHAGELPLALYTGVPIPSGTYLSSGDPSEGGDVGFHLYDILKHHEPQVSDDLVELLWTPSEILSQWEDTSEDMGLVMISGAGFAGVHNPGVYNARWDRSALVDRHRSGGGILDVRTDPGAGATSEFHNMNMMAISDLRAGTEIFPYFGAAWMDAREEEAADAKPTDDPPKYAKSHYDRADSIADDFARLIKRHSDYFSSPESRDEFWDLIRNEVVTDRKVRQLLPSDPSEIISTVEEMGFGSAYRSNPGTIRSIEWLERNGQCVDLLRSGPSTIPGAGRGAFARRPIGEGEVVTPGPLVRFTLDQLEIPPSDDEDGDGDVGYQLILNYCLAHPSNPKLLFLPHVSGANLINHSSERANVEMRWSESTNHNPYPLGLSLDEFLARPVLTGLTVDFVAIRDIREDEEILLDYGTEWEEAWNRYVEDWEAPSERGDGEYDRTTASVLNAENRPFPTVAERRAASSGGEEVEAATTDDEDDGDDDDDGEERDEEQDVFVVCSYDDDDNNDNRRDDDDDEGDEEGETKKYRMDLGEAEREAIDNGGRIRPWKGGGDGTTRKENRCEVLLRQDFPRTSTSAEGGDSDHEEEGGSGPHETLYLVRLVSDVGKRSKRYLVDVPHSAMTYVDAPYRGAVHRRGTFRHPIGIPKRMFPRAWAVAEED